MMLVLPSGLGHMTRRIKSSFATLSIQLSLLYIFLFEKSTVFSPVSPTALGH
jgi:hypothetical protein